jgi:two-component system, chemotaxis family, protein-glutamate methylesterase/glutaminase
VILSGQMDDGSAGLAAIKQCGGLALVQDPVDADAAEMPANAIASTTADAVLPVAALGAKIAEIAAMPLPPAAPQRETPQAAEHELLAQGPDMEKLKAISQVTELTCPECHGTLWEVADRPPLRYRCHTGHTFTATILAALQTDTAEEALWSAVRSLRERIFLIDRMARHAAQPEQLRQREEARAAADALEQILRSSASAARGGNSLTG